MPQKLLVEREQIEWHRVDLDSILDHCLVERKFEAQCGRTVVDSVVVVWVAYDNCCWKCLDAGAKWTCPSKIIQR